MMYATRYSGMYCTALVFPWFYNSCVNQRPVSMSCDHSWLMRANIHFMWSLSTNERQVSGSSYHFRPIRGHYFALGPLVFIAYSLTLGLPFNVIRSRPFLKMCLIFVVTICHKVRYLELVIILLHDTRSFSQSESNLFLL